MFFCLVEQLKTMKTTNPKLKILYSILGQWKSEHLNLLRNEQKRHKFNQQIQEYLVKNNLDGFGLFEHFLHLSWKTFYLLFK